MPFWWLIGKRSGWEEAPGEQLSVEVFVQLTMHRVLWKWLEVVMAPLGFAMA